jgi:FHA domain
MNNRLLFLAVALIFSALLLVAGQTAHVAALGASDNATVPGGPAGDQPQNEIKPPVEYALIGPSSQSEDAPPSTFVSFVGTSGQEKLTVNGDENWYLDLDINRPGWIYLYEYFPAGQPSPGQWLAYKFPLSESGLWRFGPFTPAYDEAEGQHVYRLWFYSNGQWAAGSSDAAPTSLIYWTYTKALPSETVTPPPAPAETGLASKVYELFTRPLVLVACLMAVVVALTVLVIYLWRRRGRDALSLPGNPSAAGTAEPLPTVSATAKIVLPNGADINIYDDSKVIGRAELARALGLDDLGLISRRHFEVKSDDTSFYIEDLGSANGTRLNNRDISGKGPVKLDDGDIIKPAGAVSLKFHIL